jgi:hypothetical protein
VAVVYCLDATKGNAPERFAAAEKSWRRLDGYNQLPKIILGVKFADGVEVIRSQAQAAAAGPLPSPRFGDGSGNYRS